MRVYGVLLLREFYLNLSLVYVIESPESFVTFTQQATAKR